MKITPRHAAAAVPLLCATVWACASGIAAGDTPAASSAALVRAAQKPGGSGIAFSYGVPASLRPGQSATLRLQFANVSSDDARVELRGDSPAVQVTMNGRRVTEPIALPRDRTTLAVQVNAPDGMQYLNVFTVQRGRTSAHSVALAVGSGKPKMKPQGEARTTPSGEKIISLPSR